jgi:hypothetical protein
MVTPTAVIMGIATPDTTTAIGPAIIRVRIQRGTW